MEVEHVEHAMAVPVFGMLCLGMFVLTIMAAGIAMLVMFIKLVSGSAPAQPQMLPRPGTSSWAAGFKVGLLAFLGLMLLGGLFFTSVRTHPAGATLEHVQPMPPVLHDHYFPQEAEQAMQRARDEAEAAMQRGRQQAEAAMHRAMAQGPPPHAARPQQVASIQSPPSTPILPAEPVSAMEAVAVAHTAATVPAPESSVPTADRTVVESSSPTGPPAWLTAGSKTTGETQSIVISSKQYATQGEAEQDVGRQVVELLRIDLRKHTSPTWVQPQEILGIPEAMGLAVRDKYVETVNRDFGSFFAPMYRVWYRVELSPQVREPALVRWRGAVATSRMMTAGGGFLALLCVPLAMVTYGRCNRWTGGKARTPLACAMAALVLSAWIAGGALFARLFVLWG